MRTSRYRRDGADLLRWLHMNTRRKGKCLVWDGTVAKSGRAYVNYCGRPMLVQRLAYMLANGLAKDDLAGKRVLSCERNRLCIRIDHLTLMEGNRND